MHHKKQKVVMNYKHAREMKNKEFTGDEKDRGCRKKKDVYTARHNVQTDFGKKISLGAR